MAAQLQTQKVQSTNWLAGLVDVMEDISAADDICRAANPVAVAGLLKQLQVTQPVRMQSFA